MATGTAFLHLYIFFNIFNNWVRLKIVKDKINYIIFKLSIKWKTNSLIN